MRQATAVVNTIAPKNMQVARKYNPKLILVEPKKKRKLSRSVGYAFCRRGEVLRFTEWCRGNGVLVGVAGFIKVAADVLRFTAKRDHFDLETFKTFAERCHVDDLDDDEIVEALHEAEGLGRWRNENHYDDRPMHADEVGRLLGVTVDAYPDGKGFRTMRAVGETREQVEARRQDARRRYEKSKGASAD